MYRLENIIQAYYQLILFHSLNKNDILLLTTNRFTNILFWVESDMVK